MKKSFRSMQTFLHLISLGAAFLLLAPGPGLSAAEPKKILVVSVTKGFRHSSIPTANKVLAELGEKSKVFSVDYAFTDDDIAAKMTPEKLKGYDGFVFANTTLNLPLPDKQAFLNEIKGGKAFVGIHSATDTFHGPPGTVDPYIQMIGGEFQTHGAQVGVECLVGDTKHPATKHFGESFCIEREEIYLLINYDSTKVRDLLYLDKHPSKKMEAGHFPIAWCKTYGQGRVFYTSLGHREDVWENKAYQQHLMGGLKWALGLEDGESTPLSAGISGESGFVPLFNGRDTTGWHLRRENGHDSWTVDGGILKNTVKEGEHGTDLVGDKPYWNFTLRYEFMVPDNSNSGLYLRGRHELQILGDFASGKPSLHGNGSIYGHTAPVEFASKPGGEWQRAEATIVGHRITLTLNGKKVHDNVECLKATGSQIDDKIDEPGPLFLQGDHGTVWFRNLRIKELPKN